MKYLPVRDFENVTSALNFDTPDCHAIGGCDLYTTKAAGGDKKLYKNIEGSLESQHKSMLRLSASLSPPHMEMLSLNLSRSSPFGPLSQVSSRRTFAYLIATLNASHPDYDFALITKPSDFRKERSLSKVMASIDETLNQLRPRPVGALLAANVVTGGAQTPGGGATWSPKMWRSIDKEMSLRECEIYCYNPEEDPFDSEESAIWSLHYFFFNKHRKRVCYIYLRGISMASHSPNIGAHMMKMPKRPRNLTRTLSVGSTTSIGAAKRAKYWLGDRVDRPIQGSWDEDGDELDAVVGELDDEDEFDADVEKLDLHRFSPSTMDEEESPGSSFRDRSVLRGMSEEVVDSMEI